jgi:hypothetical protein
MKHPSSTQSLLIFVFSLALTACGAAGSTSGAATRAEPAEVSRELAVNTARSDAARHFQALSVAATDAHQTGPYWVVELRTPSGAGMRYAISRQDGSIRQRDSFQ